MAKFISPIPEQPRQSLWDSFVSYATPVVSPVPGRQQSALGKAIENFVEAKRQQIAPIVRGWFSGGKSSGSTLGESQFSVPTPTATPTPMPNTPTRDELVRTIQNISGDAPMATMAGQMVDQVTPSAMYKTNPFLATMIAPTHGNLETRGFRDYQSQPELVYKPKQAFGWGAIVPDEKYNPSDVSTALQDVLSAVIAGRNMQSEMQRNPDEAQARMNTSNNYQFFRDNPEQNLDQYFLKYAGPRTPRNKYAGETYASNARFILNKFAEELDRLMKERGGLYPTRY